MADLSRTRVPCDYWNEGCVQTFVPRCLKAHLKICRYRPYQCSNTSFGCTEIVPALRLNEHEQNCLFKPIRCPHCSQRIAEHNLSVHVSTCESRPIDCQHKHAGCAETVPSNEMQHHIPNCPYRPVLCPHCSTSVPAVYVTIHVEDDCPATLVDCPFGCEVKSMSRVTMTAHLKVCHRRWTQESRDDISEDNLTTSSCSSSQTDISSDTDSLSSESDKLSMLSLSPCIRDFDERDQQTQVRSVGSHVETQDLKDSDTSSAYVTPATSTLDVDELHLEDEDSDTTSNYFTPATLVLVQNSLHSRNQDKRTYEQVECRNESLEQNVPKRLRGDFSPVKRCIICRQASTHVDLICCPSSHPVCFACSGQYIESELTKGMVVFPCLHPLCSDSYADDILTLMVSDKMFVAIQQQRIIQNSMTKRSTQLDQVHSVEMTVAAAGEEQTAMAFDDLYDSTGVNVNDEREGDAASQVLFRFTPCRTTK